MEAINGIFWEEEARLIQSIPLSIFKPPDILIWTAEPNEKFTTKSAYHLSRFDGDVNGGEIHRSPWRGNSY